MKRKKVFFIVHLITTLEKGGAQRILLEVVKKNKNLNYKHVIISLTEEKGFSKDLEKYVHRIYYLNGKNITSFPILIPKAYLIIKQIRPNLIQSWLYHADFISLFLFLFFKKIPIIWTIHHASESLKYESLHTKIIVYFLSKLSNFIPREIIYCSKFAFNVHNKLGYSKQKSQIIENGIDMIKFSPNEKLGFTFRNYLKIEKDEFLIGFIGRYDPNKGINCFLKTIIEIKNNQDKGIKYMICGDKMDNQNRRLISKLEKFNLIQDVILIGERSNMQSIYNSIDLLICSSLTESFGLVVVEALACGKNVIGSNIPSIRKIIKKENLVETNNYIKFAEKSLKFFRNRNENKLLSKANRDSVFKKYNIDITIESYYKLYEKYL